MATETKSFAAGDEREPRIRAVIDDCLQRRAAGETMADDALIAAHPDLMPDLATELRKLRLIAGARALAAEPIDPAVETCSHRDSDTGSGHLEVRCPSCHAAMEVAADTQLTDLTCTACGSHFSLVDQGKATRLAPLLTKLGRFELIERLGVGAFGSVWKARDKELDRTVAIKIPRAGAMSAEEQEKFFREARAAAQLRHPSIVSVHEVGRDGDSVYIVSDFVRGVTLGDWLTGQKLTSREAASLCARIADALQHAHEQGVIHRDLKPANIMMDFEGEPHLMDFGLARRDTGEVTMTVDGHILGTPAYMSPEQAEGRAHAADRRSDVYSLGVILFQLLTGELPFRGNARMLIKQVIRDEPPSPRKLNSNIDKDLETITLKCLSKEPAGRYSTARAVAEELHSFLAGQPIQARPLSHLHRAWRLAKRNPVGSGLLLTTTAALVALLIGAIIFGVQQKHLVDDRTVLARSKEAARVDAETKLYRALLDRASGLRMIRAPGYRAEVWKSLHAAASLNVPQKDIGVFRDEILACLGDPIGLPAIQSPTVARLRKPAISDRFKKIIADEHTSRFAMSPDGDWLAVSKSGGAIGVKLFDANGSISAEAGAPLSSIHSLSFSSDSQLLAAGCEEGVVVWSVPDLKPTAVSHGETVFHLATQPRGNLLATIGGGSRVELISLTSNRPTTSFTAPANVRLVEFSEDGQLLLGVSEIENRSDVIVGWCVGNTPEKMYLTGHTAATTGVAFSPDEQIIASTSKDATVRLWDAKTGALRQICRGHETAIQDLVFSPDGKLLVTGDLGGGIHVWNPVTGAQITSVQQGDVAWRLEFEPSGHFMVVAGNRRATCWEINNSNGTIKLSPFAILPSDAIYDLAVHPDGTGLIITDIGHSNSHPPRPYLFDLTSGERATLIDIPLARGFDQIKFNRAGNHLLFTTRDKGIATWDFVANRIVHETPDHFSPSSGSHLITSDDHWAAIVGPSGKQLTIYDLLHDRSVFVLPQEPLPIWSFGWSPDGTRVAVARPDGTVAIWNLSEIKARLSEFGIAVPSTELDPARLRPAPQLSQTQFEEIKKIQRPNMQAFKKYRKASEMLKAAHVAVINRKTTEAAGQVKKIAESLDDYAAEFNGAADFRRVLALSANELAWTLATSSSHEVRDGDSAVKLALKACELTEYKEANVLDTLAAAYAETGNFVEAIKWSEKALELLGDTVPDNRRKQFLDARDSYRSSRARRESPEPGSTTDAQRQSSPSTETPDTSRDEQPLESAAGSQK